MTRRIAVTGTVPRADTTRRRLERTGCQPVYDRLVASTAVDTHRNSLCEALI